ncbi:MAG TPA: hypothetical protein IAC79_03950 [Candidatus Spyradenecus faecavium]|uniref:Uncharacterized protein n=1 Tax=Candidatus Spyradenecus faecavium TaxID=2840947 RepID=A0A9D1NMQ9_9BACT|nr:hypothetical protein [Candidatus Spyradenecus faecavium]
MRWWWAGLADLRRISQTTLFSWWSLLLPAFLAVALTFIFIFRGTPEDAFSTFIFFSTLYFFWIGLFLSCRTINESIETGEWSYWVLGTRRSIRSYLCMQALYQIAIVLLMALVFDATLALLVHWGAGWWTDALVSSYFGPIADNVQSPKLMAIFLGDERTLCMRDSSHVVRFWFVWRFIVYHWLGLLMAGVSGVIVGLLLSACFRKPIQSITGAVCVVMVSIVVSFTSLDATRTAADQDNDRLTLSREDSQPPLFLPLYYIVQTACNTPQSFGQVVCPPVTYYSGSKESTIHLVQTPRPLRTWTTAFRIAQGLSYLLPQRYFFNIAHVTVARYGVLSRGAAWDASGNAWEGETPCGHGGTCPCVYCVGIAPKENFNPFAAWTPEEVERMRLMCAALDKHKAAERPRILRFCATLFEPGTMNQKGGWLDLYEPPDLASLSKLCDCFAYPDADALRKLPLYTEEEQALFAECVDIVRRHIRHAREREREALLRVWAKTAWLEAGGCIGALILWGLLFGGAMLLAKGCGAKFVHRFHSLR